jgi:hypothetical protein
VFLLYPKSFANPWSESGDRELDSWGLTHRRYSSRELRSHRSDQSKLFVEFCSGECLGVFPVVSCCCSFEFGQFWGLVGSFSGFGIS